jgi:hypothetical protein
MRDLAPPLESRSETELERCDRHLTELMQEIRVVQTGVQILFGFLLTVPLTARFADLTATQRGIYLATLASAGGAAIMLIAPSAQHRILFRCGDKQHIVRMANRYAIAGLALVGLAVAGAMLLVGDVMFGSSAAGVMGAAAAGFALWCWYLQPLRRRRELLTRREARPPDPRLPAPRPGRPAGRGA